MKKLQILSGKQSNINLKNIVYQNESLSIDSSNIKKQWKNEKNENFFLFGDFFGERKKGGISKINDYKIFEDHSNIKKIEGRFILVKKYPNNTLDIWTDYFGRYDVYFKKEKYQILISSELSLFFNNGYCNGQLDDVGIAHSLTVYGSRPAKKQTKYKGIGRLGVGEVLRISKNNIEIISQKFRPIESNSNFGKDALNDYSELFINSIKARSSKDGNIVFLSSGWDSTSILAVLVHLYGKDSVKCIIGRMIYSESSGVINQFEVDRAKAIAEYYGVKLYIVDLDHQRNGDQLVSEIEELFKYNQFSSMTGFSHWQLSKKAAEVADGDEAVFVGEMSDGAHNLGFSQYMSIFHPSSIDFREYSDKMASYLFGPTFLARLIDGNYINDPVWKIYSDINRSIHLEPLKGNKNEIIKQFFSSFFLRGGRLPLYSMKNAEMLTAFGQKQYDTESKKIYFENIIDSVSPENLYSHYMNFYNSFHWQGSTVATIEHTVNANGLTCALPFHDIGMIDFFSEMPENWGRGLDFKRTKYPLKWMLENKIDYPIELQTGPHAYTYDIDPNFSLIAEIVYRSSFTEIYQSALRNGKFISKLNKDWVNIDYINSITDKYLKNKELTVKEMTDISILSMHSLTDLN